MIIYHIITADAWASQEAKDVISADSLTTEGFIHCSFRDQIDGVIARYYKNQGELMLLQIDADLLTSELKIEPSTNSELYPHIYGVINKNAIAGIEQLTN